MTTPKDHPSSEASIKAALIASAIRANGEASLDVIDAEADRHLAKIKADALREAAETTRNEAPGEPYAGALFTSYANWLDARANQIEEGDDER